MSLNLTPDETPTDQPGTEQGYGQDPVGQTKDDCKSSAELGGGYAWDEHAQACWMIFGKAVKIGDVEHSVMEGFEVVNFNFRANGSQPAVPTQEDLPGSTDAGSLAQQGIYQGV